MSVNSFSKTQVLITLGLASLLIAGCPLISPPVTSDNNTSPKLLHFSSSDDLLNYFRQQANAGVNSQRFNSWFAFGGLSAPTAAANEDAGAGTDSAVQDETLTYSSTNLQETGVDESDVFKSDGTYFYIAAGNTLKIVKADLADELAVAGELELDLHVSEMYLYETKLILLAQRYTTGAEYWQYPAIDIWPPYFVDSNLTLVEVDISDPTAPAVTKQIAFDGALSDSRLTNGRLILVLTIMPNLPDDPTFLEINTLPLEDFLPKMRNADGETALVTWQNCLHPESPDGYCMTSVVTVDATDIESVLHTVAVVANAGTVYSSTEALYLTDTDYGGGTSARTTTAIHKFAFDNDGAAQYTASGYVPGRLLNQFSLGEYEGYLRVATHVSTADFFGLFSDNVAVSTAEASDGTEAASAQAIDPPTDYNAVYVLSEVGDTLAVQGSVENIAPDENLYSARFIGERGFLVTFERIDPLFTLDLSDPTKPTVKGELEVPGYSDYIHPWGENLLIGVGRATIESSWGGLIAAGVQLSLFDISDLENPTLIDQITMGGYGSWTQVAQTHKAFTLMADDGLLAIPAQLTDEDTAEYVWEEAPFDGIVCLQLDADTGFTQLGRLDAVEAQTPSYFFFDGGWRRPAFIGDSLYAVTADGVATAPVNDITAATTLAFEN